MKVTRVPIDSLAFDPANARKHDRRNLDAIKGSLAKFGQVEPLVVQKTTGVVIGGNGRLAVMREIGMKEVDVVEVDLSPTQATALAIALNRTAELAEWDSEALQAQLKALQLDDFPIAEIGFEAVDLGNGTGEGEGTAGDYTNKIEAPIYEPKGPCPKLTELVDLAKRDELMAAINQAEIPSDVRMFLALAAQRHVVFSYDKIAEYYAHAPADVQDLMERSALVIIDFGKAIENGFVQMSKEIATLYTESGGGEDDEG